MAGGSVSSVSSLTSAESEGKAVEGPPGVGLRAGERTMPGASQPSTHVTCPVTRERHMSVLRCTTASTVASLVAWLCWGCTAAQYASKGIAELVPVAAVVGVQSRCVLLGLGCRVVGACVLGQVADGSKQGRKGTLCWSMALIGMATLLMSTLPHGAFKGGGGQYWQALVLVGLQGVGLGGEWGASVVLPYECCCDDACRCLACALPHAAVPLGIASGVVLTAVSNHWPALAPLPFVVGGMAALCVAWGVSRYVMESPLYKDLRINQLTHTCPLLECVRKQWRSLLLGLCIAALSTFARFALLAHSPGHNKTQQHGGTHAPAMLCVWVVMASVGLWTALGGWLGSPTRLSRRPLFISAALLLAVLSLTLHPALPAQRVLDRVQRVCVEVLVLALLLGLMRGPMPSLLADLFDTSTRHSACGLVFHSTYAAMAVTYNHLRQRYDTQAPSPPAPLPPPVLFTLVLALLAVLAVYVGAYTQRCPCSSLLPSSSLSVADSVAQWGQSHTSQHGLADQN